MKIQILLKKVQNFSTYNCKTFCTYGSKFISDKIIYYKNIIRNIANSRIYSIINSRIDNISNYQKTPFHLKQGSIDYSQLSFPEHYVIIYAHLRGYTEKIALHNTIDFELKWLQFLKENHNDILIEINKNITGSSYFPSKTIDKKLATLCLNFVRDFKKLNK